MRHWIYATATALSLATLSTLTVAPASAMSIDRNVAAVPGDVEQAQFAFGGRNYCWYDNGWHGPGFYWCGYAFRRGFGWGGGAGWHGWHRGGRPVGGRPGFGRPGFGRPGFGRPGGRPGGGHGGHGGGHHR